MIDRKFIILSLPRSRSAWLSHFLSYGTKTCGHDLAAFSHSIQDWLDRLGQVDGTVETGAIIGWRVVLDRIPDARIIVVRRPVNEIIASFARAGVEVNEEELQKRAIELDLLALQNGVDAVEYRELDDECCCARLFEQCLTTPHNSNWYHNLSQTNIQINLHKRINYLISHREQVMTFVSEVEMANRQLVWKGLN